MACLRWIRNAGPLTSHLSLLTGLVMGALMATDGLAQSDPALERARRILNDAPLVDGHNDLPWEIRTFKGGPMNVEAYDLRQKAPGHTDLARLKEGGVGVQFWSVYVPGEINDLYGDRKSVV